MKIYNNKEFKANYKIIENSSRVFELNLFPFNYHDGRNPRLPKKRSKKYDLQKNAFEVFSQVMHNSKMKCSKSRFSVEILINSGNDRLGNADLDNYCKGILDAIEKTQEFFLNDSQVDKVLLNRKHTATEESNLILKVSLLLN